MKDDYTGLWVDSLGRRLRTKNKNQHDLFDIQFVTQKDQTCRIVATEAIYFLDIHGKFAIDDSSVGKL